MVEKSWGRSYQIGRFNGVELYRIEIDVGGYSSSHYHKRKNNLLLVTNGELSVTVGVRTHILTHGEQIVIPYGITHGFESKSGAEAIELYWVDADSEDIVRLTNGGIKIG